MNDTIINKLISTKHDVTLFINTLYNGIYEIKSRLYYSNTILFDDTNKYIATNTLEVLACVSKRHKTTTREHFDRRYDARWFEYNKHKYDYKFIRNNKELYDKIACRMMMTHLDNDDYLSVILNLDYLCNFNRFKNVLSNINIKDHAIDILESHTSRSTVMGYMKQLMTCDVTSDCIVFDGTALDYNVNTLMSSHMENIGYTFYTYMKDRYVCKEFIELLLQLGYDFHYVINVMVHNCIMGKLIYDTITPLFEGGYASINCCIHKCYIYDINKFIERVCMKYSVNIIQFTMMHPQYGIDVKIPCMSVIDNTEVFDKMMLCNIEYINDDKLVAQLLGVL